MYFLLYQNYAIPIGTSSWKSARIRMPLREDAVFGSRVEAIFILADFPRILNRFVRDFP